MALIFRGGGFITPSGVSWNTAVSGPSITFSNNNLDANKASAVPFAWANVLATASHSTGKFYYELKIIGSLQFTQLGLSLAGGVNSTNLNASGVDTFSYETNAFAYRISGSGSTTGDSLTPTLSSGDVIGIAVDFGIGFIWMSQNGSFTAFSTGANPASGLHPTGSFTAGLALYPAVALATNNAGDVDVRLAASGTYAFSPPSGFLSWS